MNMVYLPVPIHETTLNRYVVHYISSTVVKLNIQIRAHIFSVLIY